MKRPLKVGTLFSGIGAPEEALRQMGILHAVEFACDNCAIAKKTYLENCACGHFFDDIYDMDGTKLPLIDLLIFGFPCQPFSVAGKGVGLVDERGQAMLRALRVIHECAPRVVVAENVEGLLTQHSTTLQVLIKSLSDMGYYVNYTVLDSLDFGLPQRRRRLWIVGTRTPNYKFPEGTGRYAPLASMLVVDEDDPRLFATASFLCKQKVQEALATYEHDYALCITKTIARNGSSKEYIKNVAAVNHAIGCLRKMSVRECLNVFGFGCFRFPDGVPLTKRYEMLANTMTVPVVKAIIKSVL